MRDYGWQGRCLNNGFTTDGPREAQAAADQKAKKQLQQHKES